MTSSTSSNSSTVWNLDSNCAVLRTPQLTATVDLLNPYAGLSELKFAGTSLKGSVLGINPGFHPAPTNVSITDKFVRGNDLVVSYGPTNDRPFSLQVYWRAVTGEQQGAVLDTILSLQTDLLESFPGIAIETRLPIQEHRQLAIEGGDSYLLQAVGGNWSYAEATHPDDRGETRVQRCDDGNLLLQRQLGGRFLEKGVIRRLRVRGMFLPQENDEAVATRYLQEMATEAPPLTV